MYVRAYVSVHVHVSVLCCVQQTPRSDAMAMEPSYVDRCGVGYTEPSTHFNTHIHVHTHT